MRIIKLLLILILLNKVHAHNVRTPKDEPELPSLIFKSSESVNLFKRSAEGDYLYFSNIVGPKSEVEKIMAQDEVGEYICVIYRSPQSLKKLTQDEVEALRSGLRSMGKDINMYFNFDRDVILYIASNEFDFSKWTSPPKKKQKTN